MPSYSKPRHRRPMPGTGQAPTPSARPPNAQPAQQFESRPGSQRRHVTAEHGRIISVFGPPGAGSSAICNCIKQAFTSTRIAALTPDFGDLEAQIRAQRAEVTLLDGYPNNGTTNNGGSFGAEQVQYLYDRRLIFPGSGALVRVMIDAELLLWNRRASRQGIERWQGNLQSTEQRIRQLDLPYYVVHNEPGERGLIQAVMDLAQRASIRQ